VLVEALDVVGNAFLVRLQRHQLLLFELVEFIFENRVQIIVRRIFFVSYLVLLRPLD
jgi:hypothetical protein